MFDSSTALAYFSYSLGIIVREGLEAMLVIVALLAATQQRGERRLGRFIYLGALAALGLSGALAWSVNRLIGDNTSDALEGFFQLLAAATLVYVSSWLTSKRQSNRWRRFLSNEVREGKAKGLPAAAFALAAFLAVMREGAETIVFFQALAAGATESVERHAITGGLAAGSALLVVLFIILRRAAYRLPLQSFFSWTSIFLYALAVIFVGQGVASWQEAGLMHATLISALPSVSVLGFYPTVQTLAAQVVLVAFGAAKGFVPESWAGPLVGRRASAP